MKSKLVLFKIIVFCFFSNLEAKLLTHGYVPDDSVRIKLVSIENETDAMEFQTFYNYDGASAFVFPNSTFTFLPAKEIGLSPGNKLAIKCCKGSYVPVFMQDGGYASGMVEDGYEGPFYISMWLSIPNACETNKTHIRYALKKGTIGTIGVRIGKKGDYRLVAHDNIKFIE